MYLIVIKALFKFFKDIYDSMSVGEILAIIFSFVLIGMSLVTHHYYAKTIELEKSVKVLELKKQQLEEANKSLHDSIMLIKSSAKADTNACKQLMVEHKQIDKSIDDAHTAGDTKEAQIRAKHSHKVVKPATDTSAPVTATEEDPSDVVSPKDKEISAVRIATAWDMYCSVCPGKDQAICKN